VSVLARPSADQGIAPGAVGSDSYCMLPAMSVTDQVSKVAQRLSDEYSGQVPDLVYDEMATARVTQFVPVLVARSVRARIRERQTA
jgi:hypothetical protein